MRKEEVKPEHVLALLALFGFGLLLAKREEERVAEVRAPEVEARPVESPPAEVVPEQPVEEKVVQPVPVVYEEVETMPEPVVLTAVVELWFTRHAQHHRVINVHNLDASRKIYVYAYFSTETEKCINVNGYRLCGKGEFYDHLVMVEPKRLVIPASNVITVSLEHELTGLERIDVELRIPTLRTPRIDCKGYACGIAREIDIL
jgi:hypothetical protein